MTLESGILHGAQRRKQRLKGNKASVRLNSDYIRGICDN